MTESDEERQPRRRAKPSRTERLEAELKANLKRRKEQARARTLSREVGSEPAPSAGNRDKT